MSEIILRDHVGEDVSSRWRAATVRTQIVQLCEADGFVEIDFSGIRTISLSFADELIGVLVEQFGEDRFRQTVRLLNLSAAQRETILEAVSNRLHQAR